MRVLFLVLSLVLLTSPAIAASTSSTLPVQIVPPGPPPTGNVTVNGQASGAVLAPASQFSVSWSNMPGDAPNWIGICPASNTPYPPSCDATQHYYVNLACYPWLPSQGGRLSGSCGAMEAPSTPGNYQITIYDSGGPNQGNPTSSVNGGYGNILGYAVFSVSPPTQPSGSNYGGYLLGGDWDLTTGWSTVGISPQIWGCGNIDCSPTPMHYAIYQVDNQSQLAAAAAGNGDITRWNAEWAPRLTPDVLAHTYMVRICNEWEGNGACNPFVNGDPNAGEVVDPATWIAGVRNYIKWFKTLPGAQNVKIGFDVPYPGEEARYWPGDDVVDIVTYDIYNGNGTGGPGGVASWNFVYNSYLQPMLSYNKPLAFPEFCNKFPGGYFIDQFSKFVNSHDVVMISWWNSPGGGSGGYGEVNCQFDATADTLAAYQNDFGNNKYKYTGSFWPLIIPMP